MLRKLALLAGAAVASAFSPAALPMRMASRAAVTRGPSMQASEAIPFMEKPKNIEASMPGYAGFDPMGFAEYFDVKWMQEAEIKHGRVCMLAAVGMFHPEFAKFPQFATFSNNPLEAFYQCPGAGWGQIFAFIGIVESVSYEKCFYGQVGDGNLGFDPLGLGKNPASLTYYKVKTATHTVNSNSDTSPDLSARTHSHAVSVCLVFSVRVFVCVRFFLLQIPPNAKGSGTNASALASRPSPSLLT
mmetsp:Transcript_26932/g.39597  ORF Transcript_26932/g.39597 Transcript_26932/m.39597 type:complete len:244 (-) Transcript_26932:914-1645(-)